jgi:hypothetical protein
MPMEFVKLMISPNEGYLYENASSIEMTILGHFFTSDLGYSTSSYKKWIIDDSLGMCLRGGI